MNILNTHILKVKRVERKTLIKFISSARGKQVVIRHSFTEQLYNLKIFEPYERTGVYGKDTMQQSVQTVI